MGGKDKRATRNSVSLRTSWDVTNRWIGPGSLKRVSVVPTARKGDVGSWGSLVSYQLGVLATPVQIRTGPFVTANATIISPSTSRLPSGGDRPSAGAGAPTPRPC